MHATVRSLYPGTLPRLPHAQPLASTFFFFAMPIVLHGKLRRAVLSHLIGSARGWTKTLHVGVLWVSVFCESATQRSIGFYCSRVAEPLERVQQRKVTRTPACCPDLFFWAHTPENLVPASQLQA